MTIIGYDLHTRYQVVAWLQEEAGEIRTRRLEHENGEARAFYASWARGAIVGIESTIPALWFAGGDDIDLHVVGTQFAGQAPSLFFDVPG